MSLKPWEILFTLNQAPGSLASMASERKSRASLIPFVFMLALGFLILGITWPMVQMTTLAIFTDRVSVLKEIGTLYRQHEYFLALVVFGFCVVMPFSKIIMADLLWRTHQPNSAKFEKTMARLKFIERWSAVEVLAVAMIVVLIRGSMLGDAQSEPGLYFFVLAAITSGAGTHWLRREASRLQSNSASNS